MTRKQLPKIVDQEFSDWVNDEFIDIFMKLCNWKVTQDSKNVSVPTFIGIKSVAQGLLPPIKIDKEEMKSFIE